MQDLTTILGSAQLHRLRADYTKEALIAANAGAMARVYPRFAPWADLVGSLCMQTSPLADRDREIALIAILAQRVAGLPLANHVYWGLMEGLEVVDLCEILGLTGCYCGMPAYVQNVLTLNRTLLALQRLASSEGDCAPASVLSALIAEFRREEV